MSQTTFAGKTIAAGEHPSASKWNIMGGSGSDTATTSVKDKFAEVDENVLKNSRQQVCIRIPEDALATDTWERAVFSAPAALILDKISIVADTAFGQATNFATLAIIDKGNAGAGSDVIVTKDFDSAITAYDQVDLGTLDAAHKILVAGDVISLQKTTTGTGEKVKSLVLVIEYLITL